MLFFDPKLASEIPDLKIVVMEVAVEKVEEENLELENLKGSVADGVKSKYLLATVKDVRLFRCYRDFFWRLGIDPTKVRPASEALVRRILQGGSIPSINTAVDAINISSILTEVVIDAFDVARISGETAIRFASKGEKFLGIGMKHELTMAGGEIVISDALGPIAMYPHRDAERTGVTKETRGILTIMCGVHGIEEDVLIDAARVVSRTISKFCGGMIVGQVILLPRQTIH
jgi:DNA/RNA-binding domain of Phe-tRNA-synthetase-like protein